MRQCGLFKICREDEAGDIAGLQEYIIAQELSDDPLNCCIVGKCVKSLQYLDLVVHRRKLRFSRYMGRVAGDCLIGISARIDPSDLLQDRGDVLAGLKDRLLVNKTPQKEIAVAFGALSQRLSIVPDVAGVDKWIHLLTLLLAVQRRRGIADRLYHAAVNALHVCIGVGRVAQSVADKVKGQNADHHEQSRQQKPRRQGQYADRLRILEQYTPTNG